MYLFQLWLSQGICPVVGLLGHMVVWFLAFYGIPTRSSIVAVSVCTPTDRVGGFSFLQSLSSIYVCRFLDNGNSDQCQVNSHRLLSLVVLWVDGFSTGWFFSSTWCQLGPWAEMAQVPFTTFPLWLIWASSAQQLNFERTNPKTFEEKLQLLLKAQAQSLGCHLHCRLVAKTHYTPAQIQGRGQWTISFKGNEHIGRLGWTYTHFCCSVTKLCQTFGDPMNCSTPGSSVLHYLLQFA